MELGHWQCAFDFDPAEWFGFVYRIIDNTNNMQYIGKKQLMSVTRKTVKNKTRKKIVRKLSNWMSYTGSSDHLNEAIKTKGKENFSFIIESLHKTKGSLFYAEIEAQIFEDVLRTKFSNGERMFYNRTIANVKFVPPDETFEENQHKTSQRSKAHWQRFLASLSDEDRDTLLSCLASAASAATAAHWFDTIAVAGLAPRWVAQQ